MYQKRQPEIWFISTEHSREVFVFSENYYQNIRITWHSKKKSWKMEIDEKLRNSCGKLRNSHLISGKIT